LNDLPAPLYSNPVRTGSFPLLHPVFHHNGLDFLTLAELLAHPLDSPGSS
jgi:hypothetical protein